MFNTCWESGYSKKLVTKSKNWLIVLVLLQTINLLGLEIIESTDIYYDNPVTQINAQTLTVQLPGGGKEARVVGLAILSSELVNDLAASENVIESSGNLSD